MLGAKLYNVPAAPQTEDFYPEVTQTKCGLAEEEGVVALTVMLQLWEDHVRHEASKRQ